MASVFVVEAGEEYESHSALLAFSTRHAAEAYKGMAESHAKADLARYSKGGKRPTYLHTAVPVGGYETLSVVEVELGDELLT